MKNLSNKLKNYSLKKKNKNKKSSFFNSIYVISFN